MKYTTTFCLILLLAYVHTAPACSAGALDSLTKDEFKQEGETALPSVSILTTPSTEYKADGLCGAYWDSAEKVTCCNQDELQKRLDAMKARLKARVQAMKDQFKKGEEETDDILTDLETLDELATEAAGTTGTRIRRLIRILAGAAGKDKQKQMLTKMKGAKGKAKGRAKKAANEAIKCYKKYAQAQIKTLCLRCSANAATAFDDATKTWKVDAKFCKGMVSSCGAPLGYMGQKKAMKKVALELIKEIDPAASVDAEGTPAVTDPDQLQQLDDCIDTDCSEDELKRKNFCEKLNLDGDSPILLGNVEITYDMSTKVKGFKDKKQKKKDAEKSGTAGATRRILATAVGGYVTESATGVDIEAVAGGELTDADVTPTETPTPDFSVMVGIYFLIGFLVSFV